MPKHREDIVKEIRAMRIAVEEVECLPHGENKSVKIRNCFFTGQIFKGEIYVLWLSKCHRGH